jgi:histone H3/H4
VEATPGLLNAGVLLRVSKKTGDVQIRVANFDELPKAGAKKYSDQDKVRVCLHELPRASVARLMGYHLRRTVRAAAAKEDERISGSYTGTVAELAARFSLVLE